MLQANRLSVLSWQQPHMETYNTQRLGSVLATFFNDL